MKLSSPFHLRDRSKAVSGVPTFGEYLLGIYHTQGTREDSKEAYERGPALITKRKVVQELYAVKSIGGCAWMSQDKKEQRGLSDPGGLLGGGASDLLKSWEAVRYERPIRTANQWPKKTDLIQF